MQIVPVLMDSVSEAVDYELKAILGSNYARLQVPHLQEAEGDMDNVTPENLANLLSVAKEYVVSIATDLDKLVVALKKDAAATCPGSAAPRSRQ